MPTLEAKRWYDLHPTKLETFGYSIHEIKAWRAQEHAAQRPSGLEDFYRAHGICWACKASSIDPHPVAFADETPLFLHCRFCQGTGLSPNPAAL